MKKTLFSLIIFYWFYWISFWIQISPSPLNLENLANNWIIYLNEGNNIITQNNSNNNDNNNSTKVKLSTEKNTFLAQDYTNSNNLIINCKNWYINTISGDNYYNNKVDHLFLNYNYENQSYTNIVTLKCKPITNPNSIIKNKVLNLNYKTITVSKNKPFSSLILTTPTNPTLTWQLKELKPWQDTNTQPTFTDIIYLQLKIIWSLSDDILIKNPNINFSWLFTSNTDFENYNKWLDKFSAFSTKTEFEDTFSGAITLKDIWIANEIIKWLYKCALNNNCSKVIHFKHSILNKYDTYSFKEIENDIYSWTNNILYASINYYTNLKNTCSNTDVWDNFLNTQISSICSKLLSDQVDTNNIENYDLGYSLWIRIRNLQNIKNWINPKEWINLKWIFNIYWELNNLTLGTNKLTKVKKIIEEPSLTWKYEKLKEILKIDLKEIENKKIDNDNIKKILKANINILTPNNPLLKIIKTENPNIDLTDKNNFQIITTENWWTVILPRWVNINLSNISSLKDLVKIPEYSDKVKIIFKESNCSYKNSLGFYKENSNKPIKWEIKIKNVKSFNKGEKIYEWEIKKWLFIVSNGNIDKNIMFKDVNQLDNNIANLINNLINSMGFPTIGDYYKSKYKTKSKKKLYKTILISWKDWYTPIFFDNPSYNYNNKQQFKIEIFSWYALVKIEDMYNWDNDYKDIILKIIPKNDDDDNDYDDD